MTAYLHILKLVWPIALGMINNAVMQFVDRAFLAKDSMASLEAVLPASVLAGVFICFFHSLVGYSGVLVAQHHGAGASARARASYHAGMWVAVLSGLLMFAFVPLGGWIFSLTASSPDLVAREKAYYDVVILGAFALYGQMAAASFFTGIGRTGIVFWVNLIGNLVNVALDPILIFGLDLSSLTSHLSSLIPNPSSLSIPAMGIAGAAYATVFAQIVQFVILVWRAHRCETGRTLEPSNSQTFQPSNSQTLKLSNFQTLKLLLRYGIPAGGYEVLNMLSFTIFVFVTGTVDDVSFAVSNACFTINYLVYAPIAGFAIGAQTLVGQAMGAGDPSAAAKNYHRTLTLALAFAAVVALGVLVLRRPVLSLFAPADPAEAAEFMSLGYRLIWLMCAWILFDSLDTVVSGALKGAGDTRFVFIWMLVSAFLVWLPLVFFVKVRGGTMVQLWSTMIVYVLLIAAGSICRWYRGRWKSIRMVR